MANTEVRISTHQSLNTVQSYLAKLKHYYLHSFVSKEFAGTVLTEFRQSKKKTL